MLLLQCFYYCHLFSVLMFLCLRRIRKEGLHVDSWPVKSAAPFGLLLKFSVQSPQCISGHHFDSVSKCNLKHCTNDLNDVPENWNTFIPTFFC